MIDYSGRVITGLQMRTSAEGSSGVMGAEGDPLRRVPPFGADGTSLRHVAWNAGKAHVILDAPDDRHLIYHWGINLAAAVISRGRLVWSRP